MVTPRFHPWIGGVETHVREVGERLTQRGLEVSVLTADPTRRLPARETVEGLSVIRVPAWPRGRDWLFAPTLPALVRDGGWDLAHVQSYHTFVAPMAMAAAARAGLPYVVTFHGGGHSSRLRTRARTVQLRALRPLLLRARALIAIADFEVEHYGSIAGLPAHRFVHIPNGAELPPAGAIGQAEPPAGRLIVSSGRLERYKGHHRVLEALPHVLRVAPDARLWIAGAGPEEHTLSTRAEELGVSARVEIAAARRDVLAARLRTASVAVLLSDFETQPLAALEAASLGIPLVVADNSGMREIAAKGLARAVPADAPPAVHAEAILAELGSSAQRPHVRLPTWDECSDGLAQLYETVARAR